MDGTWPYVGREKGFKVQKMKALPKQAEAVSKTSAVVEERGEESRRASSHMGEDFE